MQVSTWDYECESKLLGLGLRVRNLLQIRGLGRGASGSSVPVVCFLWLVWS